MGDFFKKWLFQQMNVPDKSDALAPHNCRQVPLNLNACTIFGFKAEAQLLGELDGY